jgi:hypothetical protein
MSHYHFSVPMGFLLKVPDINCTSNSVDICTAECQPLLTALRFAQHNMFTQAGCIHNLVLIVVAKTSFNSPANVVLSKHCGCDVHVCAQPQNSLPKNGHEHDNDFLKHCIH